MYIVYISFYSYEDGEKEILGYVNSIDEFIPYAIAKLGAPIGKAPTRGEFGPNSVSYDMGTNYALVCEQIKKLEF